MSTNFVGNTLTHSEAMETYTPYDVTSSRPRKTTIAFFANFGGIEKLFCAPDQSLNSKIMNSATWTFSGIKKGAKISFHGHFNVNIYILIIHIIRHNKTRISPGNSNNFQCLITFIFHTL